jgi:hypothetical protein
MNHLFATPNINRRAFLQRTGSALGLTALSTLLADQHLLAAAPPPITNDQFPMTPPLNPLAPKIPHFPARAKSVIWLFMNGGQSQVDTWDHKPALTRAHGQALPNFDRHTGFFSNDVGPLLKSPFQFKQHGQSGTWVSEIFPALARHVDDMAFVGRGRTALRSTRSRRSTSGTGSSRSRRAGRSRSPPSGRWG